MAMVRSTFAGFTTAQLALAASQRSIDAVGQNISNINKEGYTRQRIDLASISPTGASYFMMQTDCRVGQGVEMTGVKQIRDPFLDIQYRTQLAKVGTIDAQDATIKEIGDIFDEIDKTAVLAALNDVVSQMNTMANPDSSNQGSSNTLVRSAFEVLLNVIHENATKLEGIRDDKISKLKNTDVPNINEYLENIATLNSAIKNAQILGGAALELQDQRNQLIDELATYLPIDVSYSDCKIGAGIVVDELKITFTGIDEQGNKKTFDLVNDNKFGEMTVDANPDKTVRIGFTAAGNTDDTMKDIPITDFLGNGVLKGIVDSLNVEQGDYHFIGWYENTFNRFVDNLATTMNELNKAAGGKELFTTETGATTGFTAANIKVSEDWMNGNIEIVAGVDANDNKDTSNITVLQMIDKVSASFGDYTIMQATQAIDRKATNSILETRTSVLNDIADNKDSVSGVWMDEEVMDLMQYQQSYNAAARLMTVMDEMIGTLILNTGSVGR